MFEIKTYIPISNGKIIGNNIGIDPIPQTPPPFGHLPELWGGIYILPFACYSQLDT